MQERLLPKRNLDGFVNAHAGMSPPRMKMLGRRLREPVEFG